MFGIIGIIGVKGLIKTGFANIERAYLLIALTIGLSYLVIIPPFEVPDEANHFYRAYQISEGRIVSEKRIVPETGEAQCGGELPRGLVRTVEETTDDVPFHQEKKVDLAAVEQMVAFHPLKPRTQFVSFPNAALYSPVPYLPSVAGIRVGRLLGVSPLLLMYLGRLFNFLAAALSCWCAIKIAPILSSALFLVVLSPAFVYQAASLSPDALTNSLSILLTALVLRYSVSPGVSLTNRELVILGLVMIAVGLCKSAYFVLALAYFAIPYRRVGTRTRYCLVGVTLFLLSAAASILWTSRIASVYVPYLPGAYPDISQPARFISASPLTFFKMLVWNLFGYGFSYVGEAVGLRLGWLDTRLPGPFIAIYAIAIAAAAVLGGRDEPDISRLQRLGLGALALGGTLLVITSQFFVATEPGSHSIREAQGRYFIPFMGLYCCMFYTRKFGGRVSRPALSLCTSALAAGSLLLALYFIVQRFYVA